MPTLNDFGDAGVARVEQQLQAFAARLGVDKEYVYAFFNHTGHLPQTLGEFQTFLNDPNNNPYHIQRRDPNTGALTAIRPGPTPGKTALERGGFPHNITNAEDTAVERFQQVDPNGNIWGGSFDPAYNAAHPELAGRSGYEGALASVPVASGGRGPTMGLASVEPGGGGPTPEQVANAADQPPTSRRQIEVSNGWPPGSLDGGGAAAPGPTQPGPSASPSAPGSAPAPYQGDSGGGGSSGGGTYTNPQQNAVWEQLANNAAQIAYNNKRLELDRETEVHRSEAEKQRLAQEAARDAWNKTYQTAGLTGYTPTAAGQSVTERATASWNALPPEQRTGQQAAAIWQSLVPGLTADEAARMNETAHQYAAVNGTAMPDDLVQRAITQVSGGRVSGQTPTLDREKEQNSTLISTLRLLADLRGPENAFAYANTLANVPDSIRGQIQAAMGRLPVQSQNPAQAGVLGDLGVQQPQAAVPPSHAASAQPAAQAGNAMAAAPGVGGLQPTQMGGSEMQAAPGSFQQYAAAGAGQGGPTPQQTALEQQHAAANAGQMTQHAQVMPQQRTLGGAPSVYQQTGPDQMTRQLAGVPVQTGTTPAMLNPNQLSPTDMARAGPYARKLLFAGYENAGRDKEQSQAEYLASLPVASGPRRGTYRAA